MARVRGSARYPLLYQILTKKFLTRKSTIRELDQARFLIRFSGMRQSPKEALIHFKVQHKQSHSTWMSFRWPEMTPLLKVSILLAQLDPSRHSQLLRDLRNEAAKSADGKCASYPTTVEAAYTLASVFRVS
jgi:hypothetical protein